MTKIVPMQSPYCSMQDENKIYSFDIEVLTEPTTSLVHPMSRFWLISGGEGTLMLNNRPHRLKPGTAVSVLPWQISDIVGAAAPVQFFVMAYYSDNINGTIKTFYNPSSDPLSIMQSLSRQPVLYLEGDVLESMQKLSLQIKGEIGTESTMDPGRDSHASSSRDLDNLYITNKLIEIIICFLRAKREIGAPTSLQTIEPSEIFQYLYSHLNEKVTLAMLSKIFYMSESFISTYITKTAGLSFFDLLGEMWIGKTINYLLYTGFTLEGLPEVPGFVNSTHISRVFSARVGMKTNDFRSTYQNIGNMCRIKDRKDFYSVVSYIYRHYSEDLRSKTVVEQFNMSPRELNRILLYQVETDFTNYLNFIRVNKASELLFKTTRSILEIVLETGYNNEEILSRNFLEFRSMTPGRFRQTIELQES